MWRRAIAIGLMTWLAAAAALAAKDPSRLDVEGDVAQAAGETPPAPAPSPAPEGKPDAPATEEAPAEPDTGDELNLGEIPVIQVVELTADSAKRAVDALALVREKYKDANLEDYESLQDFVDQGTGGKDFETDIKSFGFKDVSEWNVTITSVGFAYSVLRNDDTEDIKKQIEEIKADTTIAQDMKDRMIAGLAASIPSENNKKVVAELMKDAAMTDKLKLLDEETSGE
jgi:hypothetical protein